MYACTYIYIYIYIVFLRTNDTGNTFFGEYFFVLIIVLGGLAREHERPNSIGDANNNQC